MKYIYIYVLICFITTINNINYNIIIASINFYGKNENFRIINITYSGTDSEYRNVR